MAGGSGFYFCTACDAVRIGAKPLQNGKTAGMFSARMKTRKIVRNRISDELRKKEWIWRNLHIRQEEN